MRFSTFGTICLLSVGVLVLNAMQDDGAGQPAGAKASAEAVCRADQPSAKPAQPQAAPPVDTTRPHLRGPALPVLVAGVDGSARATVEWCAGTSTVTPATVALALGPFSGSAADGRPYASQAQGAASPASATIATPGACMPVALSVTGLHDAGPLTAELRQDGTAVATVKAVQAKAPFGLVVEGATANKLALTLSRHRPATLLVRNPDDLTYHVRWRWELGSSRCSDSFWIGPRATRELHVIAPESSFVPIESGFLRTATARGRLVLERDLGEGFGHVATAPVEIATTVQLSYHGVLWQPVRQTVAVIVLLALGVLASLAINFALPMQRQRVSAKKELASLAAELNGRSSEIRSRTLSVLRVEIARLNAEVGAHWPWFPEVAAQLKHVAAGVALLKSRLDRAYQASSLRAEVQALSQSLLTRHEAEAALAHCDAALSIVETGSPSDSDLQRAERELASARDIVQAAKSPPTDEALKEARARASLAADKLPDRPAPPTADSSPPEDETTWDALWRDFGRLLAATKTALAPLHDTEPVGREAYVAGAKALWKAELVQDFVRLVRSSESRAIYRSRLALGKELLAALQSGPAESPVVARRLLRQIEQNITAADIEETLQSGHAGAPYIKVSPPEPREHQLVLLEVAFPTPAFNAAAAREALRCRWEVDGRRLDSEALSVYHAFERKSALYGAVFTVKASVYRVNGLTQPLEDRTVQLAESPNFTRSSTLLSLATLGVTVSAVVVGLLAVAQDKLQTLDWFAGMLAVLAIGFGADVIKRMISDPPSGRS